MSGRQASPYDAIARKWLALVERRQQHFIELCDTGRWRHYYSKDEFLEEMRKVLRVRDQWAAIAGLPVQDEEPELLKSMQTPHRLLPDRLVPLQSLFDEDFVEADVPPVKARVNELPATRWPD
jgi:uncharacterized repeat protein (TIGR03809 family)